MSVCITRARLTSTVFHKVIFYGPLRLECETFSLYMSKHIPATLTLLPFMSSHKHNNSTVFTMTKFPPGQDWSFCFTTAVKRSRASVSLRHHCECPLTWSALSSFWGMCTSILPRCSFATFTFFSGV